MRFLSSFSDEKRAYACTNFLEEQGIQSVYEPTGKEGDAAYTVWVVEEDDFEKAQESLVQFQALSHDAFSRLEKPKQTAQSPKINTAGSPTLKVRLERPLPRKSHFLTNFIIALCTLLFIWNAVEETNLVKEEGMIALQIGVTPLQGDLLFDYPTCYDALQNLLREHPLKSVEEIGTLSPEIQAEFHAAEHCPYWRGAFDIFFEKLKTGQGSYTSAPLFEKIRQGEIWRVFTPCLLHANFLHILFNMSWVLILGRMIEERIGKTRMIGMIVIVAIISNVVQYLLSGPFFLGFSGVVCGMVGFIWMRQRLSPWEGYPLTSGTILFLVLFVVAMILLQILSLILQFFGVESLGMNIANSAHIVGGLTGILLARIPIFSRSPT